MTVVQLHPKNEQMLRRRQLAAHLNVSDRTVDRMVREGCPTTRYGRRIVLFSVSEVLAWMRDREAAA